MNMKKISALLLAAAVSVTLFAGCGNNNAEKNNAATNNTKVENKEENNKEENNKEEENKEEVALQDGTFRAEKKDFDEHGWKAFAEVTVKEGKIEAVVFDYTNEAGDLKTADEEYNKNMEEKAGTSVAKAAEELAAQLVEKQNVEEVEVVTGATSSTEDFKAVVTAALEASKEGATEATIVE